MPETSAVQAFLQVAETAEPQEEAVGKLMTRAVSDADAALFVEARRVNGAFVHRTYLAK